MGESTWHSSLGKLTVYFFGTPGWSSIQQVNGWIDPNQLDHEDFGTRG